MKSTDLIDNDSLRSDVPDFQAGDELKVHVRVVEGGKERIQVFQGDVIGRQGGGLQETYTVRKLSYGVGVERTFPLHTPTVQKIEVVKRGDVRPRQAVLPARSQGQGGQDPREAPRLLSARGDTIAALGPNRSLQHPDSGDGGASDGRRPIEHRVWIVGRTRRRDGVRTSRLRGRRAELALVVR